jgi:hypothetical protein
MIDSTADQERGPKRRHDTDDRRPYESHHGNVMPDGALYDTP